MIQTVNGLAECTKLINLGATSLLLRKPSPPGTDKCLAREIPLSALFVLMGKSFIFAEEICTMYGLALGKSQMIFFCSSTTGRKKENCLIPSPVHSVLIKDSLLQQYCVLLQRNLPGQQSTMITASGYSPWQYSNVKNTSGWLYPSRSMNRLEHNKPAHRWIESRPVLAELAKIKCI